MKTFPRIEKKISSFLIGEEGKISKKNILTIGFLIGSLAATIISSNEVAGWHNSHGSHSSHNQGWHDNNLTLTYDSNSATAIGTHDHCLNTPPCHNNN